MLRAVTAFWALTRVAGCMTAGPEPDEVATILDGGDLEDDAGRAEEPPPSPGDGVRTGGFAPELDLPRLDGVGRWSLTGSLAHTEATCPSGALVAFMASWCGPCEASLPTLAAIERAFPMLDVVTVVVDETPAGRAAELAKVRGAGIAGPVLVSDAATALAWTGGTRSVPRFVFVGRDGRVVAQDRGFGDDVKSLMPRQASRTARE
jgi:thiol-disulfide isomerase/thioredoxin